MTNDLKQQALQKITECDLINNQIVILKNKEQTIMAEVSQLKKQIENQNQTLIGKKAICSGASFTDIVLICTAVKCNYLFEITPLFSRNDKKVSVDFYNWLPS